MLDYKGAGLPGSTVTMFCIATPTLLQTRHPVAEGLDWVSLARWCEAHLAADCPNLSRRLQFSSAVTSDEEEVKNTYRTPSRPDAWVACGSNTLKKSPCRWHNWIGYAM
ncbi:hypothetical protein EVAR_9761_1 [Eumeta japonica]|uniref:Uncharacterized protein n=1 Tax=Eumeta variegata TaxID=151549 RepID=A0A4C1U6W6_EUMVA|nr:hypothetical protein EVAR_9761_1 [Eumeta japonica]